MVEHQPGHQSREQAGLERHLVHRARMRSDLAVVDAHFHNENPEDIDKAISLYGDSVVWEVPARGVLLRDKAAVREAYLNIFKSYNIHSMTQVRRFGAEILQVLKENT